MPLSERPAGTARPEARTKLAGFFAGLLLLALAAGYATDYVRVHRAAAGDVQTLQILTEDYHWPFVVRPDRVDNEIWEFFKAGAIMYPIMPVVYAPHMAAQLLFPAAGDAQFVFTLSVYLTLLLLTGLYFVGLKKGLSSTASFLITAAVLLNPFLLYLLASAPVIPSAALLPLAYLAYISRRRWAAFALFLVIALSYRFGSFFLFLLVLSEGPPRKKEDAGLFKYSLLTLGALMCIQTASQFLLVQFNDYVKELEGLRVGYTFGMLKRFFAAPLSPDVLFREFQVVAWLAAGGFALFLRPATRWRIMAAAGVLGYLGLVTGLFSMSVVLATGVAGVALVTGTSRLRRRQAGLAAAGLVGAMAVAFLAPVFPAPTTLSEKPALLEEGVKVTTLAGFYRQALALPEDQHLAGVHGLLEQVAQTGRCSVDPLLVATVPASACAEVVPLGKTAPEDGILIDRVIYDESPGAEAFRAALVRDLRGSEQSVARFEAVINEVRQSGKFGVSVTWDGLLILDRLP